MRPRSRTPVARAIDRHALRTVVLDPVMVSATGAPLIEPAAAQALVRELVARATPITPNLDEAALLLGRPIASVHELAPAAQALLGQGARALLLKGGHLAGDAVVAVLAIAGQPLMWMEDARIATPNLHGADVRTGHGVGPLNHGFAPRATETRECP